MKKEIANIIDNSKYRQNKDYLLPHSYEPHIDLLIDMSLIHEPPIISMIMKHYIVDKYTNYKIATNYDVLPNGIPGIIEYATNIIKRDGLIKDLINS